MANISINPFTRKSYELPEVLDDQLAIEDFINKNPKKPIIVVQGLGFVGGVMSLVCANAINEDYAVIGLDLPNENSYWKICSFNENILPLKSSDPKVEEFFKKSQQKGNLYATFDPISISYADVVIVDVNLDVSKKQNEDGLLLGFDVDLEFFSSAIRDIASNCKPEVLILIETTVPPGTCEKIAFGIIQKGLEDRNLDSNSFKLGHSYERVMPGPNYIDSIQNYYRVYSGINEESADATESFLRTIISTEKYPLTRLNGTNATELAKVLENSYRAMNIAFMVEWTRFAEEAGVNIYEVVHAIRQRDTHSNLMFPGLGVGGYCLSKDPLLASWSRKSLFNAKQGLPQSEMGVKINDQMPLFAFNFLCENVGIKKLFGLRTLLLGASYRGDVGDTRYSPVELFYKLLKKAGSKVLVHDYFVDYWPECNIKVETNLKVVLEEKFDMIIITTSHSDYRENPFLLSNLINSKGKIFYDTLGFMSAADLQSISKNNQTYVLGRGNI